MIFVTGAAGFIGSNFIHHLKQQDYNNIVILDKLTYAGDMENLYDLMYPVKGVDIADHYRLNELFSQYRPRFIFNFAAETHVDNSIQNVTPFINSNIIGTTNLLDLADKHDVSLIVVNKSDLSRFQGDYGFEGFPLRKDFPLTGHKEVRYSEDQKKVINEPVKLEQNYRNFDYESPWEGTKYIKEQTKE